MRIPPSFSRQRRGFHYHRKYLYLALALTLVVFVFSRTRPLVRATASLLALPFTWRQHAAAFHISQEADGFDLSFASYDRHQASAEPDHRDLVPAVLHHIVLGAKAGSSKKWQDARQSCLDLHPGWEAHFWDDDKARAFVADKFPEFMPTWDGYRFPIQRVDALRYLVLHEYGGVILDMDLKCKRSLGPLRRFGFVAPAAFPTGFSIGFMMASRHNTFVADIIRNLKVYDRQWFGMPYTTVMFSTGCHFASTIHASERNRTELKILAGPKDNFKLHSLNGPVSTPLFDHLGSSSWHAYDASLIVALGRVSGQLRRILIVAVVSATLFIVLRRLRRQKLKSPV